MPSTHSLRQPFVITLSVAAMACGSEVVAFSSSSGTSTAGSGASSTSSGQGAGGASTTDTTNVGVTVTATTVGGGATPINCPATPPSSYMECTIAMGETCTYSIDCQSGTQAIQFECNEDGFGWQAVPQACLQYDSCPGTELHCYDQWWLPQGTNPPSPCPQNPPEEFTTCHSNEMGGTHANCGYRCEDSDVWTVATCVYEEFDGTWEYDGACAP